MVKYYTHSLDVIFMALADPTRRAILTTLADGDATVSELAKPFNMSLPAISKHLGILENAGLIVREKQGRVNRCRLRARGLKEASDWLAKYQEFWEAQLDSLAKHLETKGKEK